MRALMNRIKSQQKLDRRPDSQFLGRVSAGVITLALGVFIGCGGGTTGTSSSDSVQFSGFAEGVDGVRAARLSMTVTSAATSENLVDSGTDDSGDFSMELPADEEAFVVDVEGVGSTQIARQQRGVGTMTSKLAVTSAGALVAEDVFEAQPIGSILCASLTLNGSAIVIAGNVGNAPCEVAFSVASRSLPLTSFRGEVTASCAGSTETVTSAGASAQGVITLDLNYAFSRGCSDIKVSITSPQAPGLRSEFPVL